MKWIWLGLIVVPFVLAYTGYRQWRPKRASAAIATEP